MTRHALAALSLLAALAAPTAQAARHEVSVEFDNRFLLENDVNRTIGGSSLQNVGVRGGYAVLQDQKRFGLVVGAAWQRSRRGGTRSWYDEEAAIQDSDARGAAFQVALITDTFLVGAKADYDVKGIFFPYVRVETGLVRASYKLDDDPRRDDNVNQYSEQGLGGTGIGTLGFELMLPDRRWGWPVTAAWYLEGGGQVASVLRHPEFGAETNVNAGLIRTGIGLRF